MAEVQSSACPRSWSDIPPELAGEVLRLLPALVDRIRFAAVCPRWRAAAQELPLPPPPLPLLARMDGTFHSLPREERFRFPGCPYGGEGYRGSCDNWLVFPRGNGFFLLDPFSKATKTLPQLPCRYYGDDSFSKDAKLIFCSPDLVAAAISTGEFPMFTRIAVCHPQGSSWSVHSDDQDHHSQFEDIELHRGKLYSIDENGNLLVIETSNCSSILHPRVSGSVLHPRVSRVSCVIKANEFYENVLMFRMYTTLLYLVESCSGSLLMVRRLIREDRVTIDVFKADFGKSQWTTVTTLGSGETLFLGRRCSKAVDVSQYGMPGDYIFFLDDDGDYSLCEDPVGSSTALIPFFAYNMKDGKVSSPPPMFPWKQDKAVGAWLFRQA